MFYFILLCGFLINAGVLTVGIAYYKLRGKNVQFSILLIVNVVASGVAFVYGFGAGAFEVNPYFVQTVGLMSFGMLAFCFVTLLFYLKQHNNSI